jgi:hypothetical protein
MAVISTNAYGDLDLKEYAYRYWQGSSDTTWGYTLSTDKGNYVFLPDDFISKGFVANKKQYYAPGFTNKTLLTELYTKYQPMDLGGFKDFGYADALYDRLKEMGYGTTGVLVPESWATTNLVNTPMKTYQVGSSVGNVAVGAIKGLGEKDGQMVYVPEASGPSQASAYISGGQTYATWQPELKWYQRLAKDIAKIPLFPEIAAVATAAMGGASYAPYVYAALKGATLGAQGVDPLKAGLMVGINIGAQTLGANTDFAKSIGASFGATDAATQLAVGKAVIGASANGVRASLTGGDVTQAMLDGALTAGAGATVASLSKTALGTGYSDIINKISGGTNLTAQQVHTLVASSLVSGITSEIKGGDFATTFKNSLISSGVGQSLANEVSDAVGNNVSPEVRAAIAKGTSVVAGTATNAILNNQDITKALESNLPATIYSTMTEYTEQKNREASAKAAGWSDYAQQQAAKIAYGDDVTPARFRQETDARAAGWDSNNQKISAQREYGDSVTPDQYRLEIGAKAAGWTDFAERQLAESKYGTGVTPEIYKKEVTAKSEGWNDFGEKISAENKYGPGITFDDYQKELTAKAAGWTDFAERQLAESKYGSDITPIEYSIKRQVDRIAADPSEFFGDFASSDPVSVTDVSQTGDDTDDYTIKFDDGSSITFNRITGEVVDVMAAPREPFTFDPYEVDNVGNRSEEEILTGFTFDPYEVDNVGNRSKEEILTGIPEVPEVDPYEVDNVGNRSEDMILVGMDEDGGATKSFKTQFINQLRNQSMGSAFPTQGRMTRSPYFGISGPSLPGVSSQLSGLGFLGVPEEGFSIEDQEFPADTSPIKLWDPGISSDWAPQTKIGGLGFAGRFVNQDPNQEYINQDAEEQERMLEEARQRGWMTEEERAALEQQPNMFGQGPDNSLSDASPWLNLNYAEGGHIDHNPEFYSEGGASLANRYVKGGGDGTSDSVPAMLASGEFVIPADVVSGLGNGDNDAGAQVLDEFMAAIRQHKRSTRPTELPPDSEGPLAYLEKAKKRVEKNGRA